MFGAAKEEHMSRKFLSAILALVVAALACNLPGGGAPTVDPAFIFTAAALTVDAASQGTPEQAPTQANPAPSLPEAASVTPPSPQPGATNTTQPCNLATFVADVTIPDNTEIVVNKPFTKTWRLKNVGTCAWTSGYQLVFDGGDVMSGPAAQTLTNGTVAPGQTVDVSVNLIAPASPGTYRGNWKLRDPGGVIFSLTTGNPFWVQIKAVKAGGSLPDWPTLKKGSTGAEVYALQYLLNDLGYALTVDGILGNKTRQAVEDFQQDKGLKVDGIVGAKTWAKLVQGAQVSNGSSGDDVRAAQYLLANKYGYGIAIDGLFGAKTREAVIDFQKKKNLDADGIVGPQTWQALISY